MYRVVKVDVKNYGIKYLPQYKIRKSIKVKSFFKFKYKFVNAWENFYEVRKGTDDLVICYFDTIEEAWDRIDKRRENMILNEQKYDIIKEYYV
jgi:hypothetical protein